MWWWKDAFLRLRALFFRREMDEELQAEIAVSSGDAGEKESLRGLTPKRQDARPAAVRRLRIGKGKSVVTRGSQLC